MFNRFQDDPAYNGDDPTPGKDEPELMLTPQETASLLALHTRTLANYAKRGQLRFIWTPGGQRRFPASAVRAASEGRWKEAGFPEGDTTPRLQPEYTLKLMHGNHKNCGT